VSAREPRWLSREMVGAIHAGLIGEHGGSYGVRDDGLIESALVRPPVPRAYEEGVDLAELAAAYGYGLAKNHGYIDGNKRMALTALGVFLDLNGQELDAPEPEAVGVMEDVAAGALSEPQLATWIRAHLRAL
jgi:death-on-curing protein